MYRKCDIFVYTGSGNAYKVAKMFGETAKESGSDYEIKMINKDLNPKEYKPERDILLGLISCTLGFIQPINFFKFIAGLPKGNGMKVFLAGTGAYMGIGRFIIHGITGCGLYIAALMLMIKGYSVTGINSFGMPNSWTTIFPPYWKSLEERIIGRISILVKDYAKKLLEGQSVYKQNWNLPVGILLLPFSIMFIFGGHIFLLKLMFANHKCNGCGLCAANCPNQAIEMNGNEKKHPYWTFKCEQCMKCVCFCPSKAIESSTYLLGCLYMLVFYMVPLNIIAIDTLSSSLNILELKESAVLDWSLYLLYNLIILQLGYFIFHYLLRIPLVARVFAYTSMSYYWRKYSAPGVKSKELK